MRVPVALFPAACRAHAAQLQPLALQWPRAVACADEKGRWLEGQMLLLVSPKECFLYLGTSEAYWKYLPLLGPVCFLPSPPPPRRL